MEGKGFRDGIRDFESRNAVILGISFDTVEENRAFAEKFAFPYPLLSDRDRKIGLMYHATSPGETRGARRITYLIDPEGKIARAFETVDAATHPAEVLAAIDAAVGERS